MAIITDTFYQDTSLKSHWRWVDRAGDCSYAFTGTNLAIAVASGTTHDLYHTNVDAPRILQTAPNTDFRIQAKFASQPHESYMLQGIVVQASDTDLLRFGTYYGNSALKVYAARITLGGSTVVQVNATMLPAGPPYYYRVTRVGDHWTYDYSYDGITWTQACQFTEVITVADVGVYAGNAGSSPPAYTASIDYFWNTAMPLHDDTVPPAATGVPVPPPALHPLVEPLYRVDILDRHTGQLLHRLDTTVIKTLKYERVINDIGMFQLTLPLDHAAAEALQVRDQFVEVYRFPDPATPHREGTFQVQYFKKYIDDHHQGWLIVSGFSLAFLLTKRQIDPRNDPLSAGGYSTKDGPADAVMVSYVQEQAGADAAAIAQIPNFTVTPAAGLGNAVGRRLQWKPLLDELQTLAAQGGVDFWLERGRGTTLVFKTGIIGTDRSKSSNYPLHPFILFEPRRGNLVAPSLTRDWKKAKNHIYLLGRASGVEGDVRDIYEQSSAAIHDSPYSFAAIAQDARHIEDGDATQYLTQAMDELKKHQAATAFGFKLDRASEQYRTLWNLGDRVSVAWDGFAQDMRITGIEVRLDARGESLVPTLEVA
jgi:regulation of enolase protein 1 (concanavalin A-like superfamily)